MMGLFEWLVNMVLEGRWALMLLKFISFDVGETLVTHHYLEYVWNEVIPKLYAEKTGRSSSKRMLACLKENIGLCCYSASPKRCR